MPTTKEMTDEELIERLRKDDQEAFTEIYHRYAESLAAFAGAKLQNLEDARDILHDLFVRLWEQRGSLSIQSSLKSYLFAAIRYGVIDRIRRNITRREYAGMIQALERSFTLAGQDLDARELQEIIDRSLEKLPARTQEIYRLSRNDQYSVSQIAVMLELSEQTVKNQLTTALNHLRQSIVCVGLIIFINGIF
jgi:RNA polymerase sigma-70 factor (family 1)